MHLICTVPTVSKKPFAYKQCGTLVGR